MRDERGLHAEVFDATDVVRGVTFTTPPENVEHLDVFVDRSKGVVEFILRWRGRDLESRLVSFLEGA